MSYITSYDSTASGPFKPNKDRGFWANSNDFFYACMCNAFRMDLAFGFASFADLRYGGMYIMLISMLLNMVLFAYPIVFMQSFLGQFSSTGFISAFRVAPLFKGVGYIALASNLYCLTYYAIFAAIPILFFINSLNPNLPWSCDGRQLRNYSYENAHCIGNESKKDDYYSMEVPSVEYFWEQFCTFSFSLYGCVIIVWLVVAVALCSTTEKIGQMLRYGSLTVIILLGIVFLRMMFLPGVIEGLQTLVETKFRISYKADIILTAFMLTLATFGPGWGSILSMASHNRFKTDINKFSWLICFSQFGVLFLMGFLCLLTESHFAYTKPDVITISHSPQLIALLTIPSSLATMEFPHLWTWMFLALLIIGNFNLMITQMFSTLTALFDEFEKLRPYKVEVTLGLSISLALVSAGFCTRNGIKFTEVLTGVSISTQGILNLLLFIIVAWVYGRERFQRDVEFMTSQVLQTWKIYAVRFITPFFLGITLMVGLAMLFFEGIFHYYPEGVKLGVFLTIVSWVALPVYCLLKLLQTNGSLLIRFKRYVKPTDWYPTEIEQMQRYEETIDNPETCQPLTAI